MKKNILAFLLCFCLLTTTAGGAEPVASNGSDFACRLLAGYIWRQSGELGLEEVIVIDNVISIETGFGYKPESEQRIRDMAPQYRMVFKPRRTYDAVGFPKTYSFTVGEKYIKSNGMLLEWKEAPYFKDGIPMISFRELMDFCNDVSPGTIRYKWEGGEEQIIKIGVFSLLGDISVKNNTVTQSLVGGATNVVPLEGKVEIINGVTYFPMTLENFTTIHLFGRSTYDEETGTFTLSL